jgi:hypothetical protein
VGALAFLVSCLWPLVLLMLSFVILMDKHFWSWLPILTRESSVDEMSLDLLRLPEIVLWEPGSPPTELSSPTVPTGQRVTEDSRDEGEFSQNCCTPNTASMEIFFPWLVIWDILIQPHFASCLGLNLFNSQARPPNNPTNHAWRDIHHKGGVFGR